MTYDEFKQNFLPEFLNITSFAGRMKYADQNLQRIGSGTGRVVYDIDGEKVLKLAMNAKGVAQNGAEAGAGYYRDTQHIVTEVFDSADDDTWVIAEHAKKVGEKRIKEVTGIPSLNDLFYFLRNQVSQNNGKGTIFSQPQEMVDFMWENEFASDLIDFVVNYGQTPGDMGRPSSYGEVIRDGQPAIVLTDYGLNDEVYDTHYSPDRKKSRYNMYELFNFADGNDDILSDAGGGNEIRTGMWAQMPYSVSDGGDNSDAVINEKFVDLVSNRDKYPDKPVAGLPVLTDAFHECVNNLKETLGLVADKKKFYENLLKLQEYLIRRGFYNRDPLMSEEYNINETDVPDVEYASMDDKNYAMELAKQVAIKLDLTAPRYLGGGGFGHAFEINDNVILKITSDMGEADAASRLIRANPTYLGDVYNLYKIYDSEQNKSFYAILEENIQDKPTDAIRKTIGDINKITPNGMDYEDMLISMKSPNRFNYDEMVEQGKAILTDNPESGVSQQERQHAYEFYVGLMNIRKELLDYGIKSTDYITMSNLGYKDGVLKFFDIGGHIAPHPNIDDNNLIQLPENKEVIDEDYDRNTADVIANRVAEKMGLSQPKFIAAGANGVAYDIGDEKVLKITKDNSEANDNIKLIGRPLKYIAQPYNVFEVNSKSNPEMPRTFVIILEKLKTDSDIHRMNDRLNYAFENIMGVKVPDVIEYYLGDWDDGKVSKEQVNSYLRKNPRDAEFFGGLVRIAEETRALGIDSMDYLNPDNLGYKENGALGFFDVGFGNYFAQPEAEKMEVAEDGSAKFSTPNAVAQDDFPPYDSNDTSPMINNDLDANIAMYEEPKWGSPIGTLHNQTDVQEALEAVEEDLEYNHVDGDATQDEYKLEERDKSYGKGSKTVKVKRKCQLAGLGNTSVACNQGDINNLEFGKVNEEDLEVTEYFSSLVPDMNEDITTLQDLPFREDIEQLGGKIFSVGGAVRDEFLGKESKDLDVLVTGVPMDSLAQLLKKYGGVNTVGASFGVIKFVPQGSKEEIDIAIPRTEVATGAGGHQGFDVTSDHELPIEKDLERRDFTINAIAKDIDGNIIDPFNGQQDLKDKVIRIVNPEAFSDDPLRMLRAVQFASRFGFTIEPKTMQMIKENAGKIREIAPERILIELDKIVTKGNARIGIELLASTGLFKQIFGNEIKASQIGRRDFEGVRTMAELLFLMMNGVVQNPAEFYLTRFATEDAKRDKVYKELQALDLAFNSDLVDQQMPAVKARSVAHNMYTTAPQTLESQVIPEVIANAGQELLQGKYPKTVNELAVNGNDLMNAGLQGKAIGDMQKAMLIRIYADNIRNNREELLSLVTEKNNEVQEGYPNWSEMQPKTWNVNGNEVTIDYFIQAYDKWNHQGGTAGYSDASRESVLEFLQNNFEDFSVDEKLKKELYWALTDRDLLSEEEVKRVSYSAVVLDDKSRASLLKVFQPMIPEGWEVIAHHMTINMGEIDTQYKDLLGTDAELTVTSYAMDDLVMAVGVKGFPTMNQIPHITIAVNRADGGKPFFSNKLNDWKPINFPIRLSGKVMEV